jgi:transposase
MTVLEADKGYESQWLRQLLHEKEIFPLIPKRRMGKSWRKHPKIQNVCEFFKIKSRRWQVERAFSWLKRKCRRLFIRWEKKSANWLAILKLSVIDYWLEIFEG